MDNRRRRLILLAGAGLVLLIVLWRRLSGGTSTVDANQAPTAANTDPTSGTAFGADASVPTVTAGVDTLKAELGDLTDILKVLRGFPGLLPPPKPGKRPPRPTNPPAGVSTWDRRHGRWEWNGQRWVWTAPLQKGGGGGDRHGSGGGSTGKHGPHPDRPPAGHRAGGTWTWGGGHWHYHDPPKKGSVPFQPLAQAAAVRAPAGAGVDPAPTSGIARSPLTLHTPVSNRRRPTTGRRVTRPVHARG